MTVKRKDVPYVSRSFMKNFSGKVERGINTHRRKQFAAEFKSFTNGFSEGFR